MGARLTSRGIRADLTRAGIAIGALYPISIAALLVVLPIMAPRSGPLALATVLSMHLALAALALVPFAAVRGARSLRVGLLALALVSVVRFGGEWVSIPASDTADPAADIAILSWNLEFGARAGEAAIDGLRGVDADVIVLQELGPEHAAAIEADADLTRRYPFRELVPRPGVFGMGVLTVHPIRHAYVADDPVTIETLLDVDGRLVTIITGHPFPGRIAMAGPLPVSFDPSERDVALVRFRDRVDAAIARGETVIVAGDFNVAPTEPAYEDLTRGLADAHVEIGLGAGLDVAPEPVRGIRCRPASHRPGAGRPPARAPSRSTSAAIYPVTTAKSRRGSSSWSGSRSLLGRWCVSIVVIPASAIAGSGRRRPAPEARRRPPVDRLRLGGHAPRRS